MIRKFRKLSFSKLSLKFVSSVTILALMLVVIAPQPANAATITSSKATFGRLKESIANEFGTLQFNSPTGIQAGTSDDIIITFSSDFVLAAEVATNFDIELGDAACATANFADEGVVTTGADASNWNVDVTGDVITLEPDTNSSLAAGFCFRLVWGTAATSGGTGSASTITNGPLDDDDSIVISGGFGDSGTILIDIINDDQVFVTATVGQSITFDLDTSVADAETDPQYNVALGTITTTDTRVSGTTDSVNMIIAEGETSATGGMVVTVRNANGANGLVSTSVPADDIDSADGDMIDGTENYGLCVMPTGLTGFTIDTAYTSTDCVTNSETNDVEGLTTAGENILNSAGVPLANGHAEISVNAAISSGTAAHADYADTLTFIATATF